MRTRFLRRLLQSLLVLLAVALMIFVLIRVVPGDPVETMMGEHVDPAAIERMTAELGLDRPLAVQFGKYLLGALRGDFGTSYTMGRPVAQLILTAFPNTLLLSLAAALFAWVVGILCGVLSAVKKNSFIDRLFMGFSLLGVSMPVFMTAMLLQYVFAHHLHWLDISGLKSWRGYILPAVALGWNSAGSISRLVRSSLAENLQADYTDTARAKGRGQAGVVLFHAMRNAMLPVVTMMAMQLSSMLSGAVITESVFSINGIGRLAVQAIEGRDIPLLEGTALFATALVILGNLAADSLYAVLDPRIRKEE